MKLTLSFDNGPEPEATPGVLDVLARRGIRATFFVIGEKLLKQRSLAERAVAEGHWVGNHTLTHGVPLGRRPAAEARAEIEAADALLGNLNPHRLFRPNGGGGVLGPHLLHRATLPWLEAERRTVVLWNAIPRDWDDPDGWPPRALAQYATAAEPLLMVLHDLDNGAWRHLDRVLGQLADAGAEFTQEFPESCTPLRDGRWTCEPEALSSGG